MDKNNLINKFLQIEANAYRGRHLVETMDKEGMIRAIKRIRHDLEELEIEFKVE